MDDDDDFYKLLPTKTDKLLGVVAFLLFFGSIATVIGFVVYLIESYFF